MSALPAGGPLDHVVVHHSAYPSSRIRTREAEARHVREIQRWHVDRGFLTIGYHFVIAPSGRIYAGRPVDRIGANVLGHNRGTVGICLMGDFRHERPTAAALRSLDFARGSLVPGGASVPVRGHREHQGHETNECPGRHLLAEAQKRRGPPRGGPLRTGIARR